MKISDEIKEMTTEELATSLCGGRKPSFSELRRAFYAWDYEDRDIHAHIARDYFRSRSSSSQLRIKKKKEEK